MWGFRKGKAKSTMNNQPIDDGGQAFPSGSVIVPQPGMFTTAPAPTPGMTLRDYFAAKAMAGWLASYSQGTPHPARNECEQSLAELSYALADAMLAARNPNS